jgi:rhodanese-related sulfurtransferase
MPLQQRLVAVCMGLLSLLMAGYTQAMTLEVSGNILFASGYVGDDLPKFQQAFDKGGIDTIVFVNSPGGDLETGLRVGRLIAERDYTTVVAGFCNSSCSIMFMGGKKRLFSDALPAEGTSIGIHGAHVGETKQVHPVLQPQIYAYYKQRMGEQFNAAIINQALYEMQDAGSMLYVYDLVRRRLAPLHCNSGQTPAHKCTRFNAHNALSLGIVTERELMSVQLPVAFKPTQQLWGPALTARIEDLPGFYNDLAQRHCPHEACKVSTPSLAAWPENRGLAVSIEGQGVGYAHNRPSLASAMAAAVYSCNHRLNHAATLCEAQVINNFDMRPWYAQAKSTHAASLHALQAPAERFYANEEYGGGFTRATGFRTEKLADITPQSLDGIDTVGTQALALALKSTQPPTLIDVGGQTQTLPGAKLLLFGGLAFDDARSEAGYDKRFAALLKLLAPDPSAALVFYCSSRNCWLSVNAALRAKKLGYAQVQWYRGGLESWLSAGLPTAPAITNAVAN